MCIICSEWERGKLTNVEAMRNINEVTAESANEEEYAHYEEALSKFFAKHVEDTLEKEVT